MSAGSIPVTIVIPVRNEAGNIVRCLERLTSFQAVVVVDSASTDQTAELARSHGAKVIQFKWDGNYPKKRNWFLLNHQIETDWILFLDADELLGEKFIVELAIAIADPAMAGYWIRYTNYFLGKQLSHGLPQRKLALFRFGRGLYERIDEHRWSNLDMEVHEHPIIDGQIGELKAQIDHNDDRGMRKFIERHVNYAQWEAERFLLMQIAAAAANGAVNLASLTQRQRAKYKFIRAWWYPGAYFLYTYFVRLGFLDGWAGLAYAAMKFWYFTLIQTFIADPFRRQEDAA